MIDRSIQPRLLPLLLLLGLPMPAGAQSAAKAAPPETVTVTGHRTLPAQIVDHFVKSYTAPTLFLGKLGRWDDPICPRVSGLKPEANAFIQQRVLAVAAMMRVKADTKTPCRANVEIVFTTTPQAFMDDVRKNHPNLLGFHNDSSSQAERMAQMTHPIQAWYASDIVDYRGAKFVEETYGTCKMRHPGPGEAEHYCYIGAVASLIRDGQSSDFYNVLIVADSNKVANITVRPLADYVAMLALAQTQPSDSCQELPTIANLLAPGCDPANVPAGLTDVDLSFLKALYDMEPDEKLAFQRGDIASRMKRALNPP